MKILAVIICCAISPAVFAQWVPVTGIVETKTEVVSADGTITSKWKTKSSYARSSTGSVVIQRIGRSGRPVSGVLLDYGGTGHAYSLGYRDSQVTDIHQPLDKQTVNHPPSGMSEAHKKVSSGQEEIKGVACFVVPLYDTGPNRTRVKIGRAWMAPAYNNLIIREEYTRSKSDGSKRHIMREMTITGQTEPDRARFSVDRQSVGNQWKAAPTP